MQLQLNSFDSDSEVGLLVQLQLGLAAERRVAGLVGGRPFGLVAGPPVDG